MSDELTVNGAVSDVDVEIAAAKEDDSDGTSIQTIQKLMQKVEILEQEKKQLEDEKNTAADKIKQLEDEIASSESDKRALSSIAARAAELETEVSRLQHDLISAMSEGQESSADVAHLKKVVEALKKSESEKTEKIDVIEKERELLLERLDQVSKRLKDSENQKLKIEQDVKTKLGEKDEQIKNLNRMVDEFKSVIVNNSADIELLKKEKDELEAGKNELEARFKKSEVRVNELESKIDELQKDMNSVVKEKELENINGIEGDEKVKKSLKPDWPVIAATTGAVALVAVVYFRHAKF